MPLSMNNLEASTAKTASNPESPTAAGFKEAALAASKIAEGNSLNSAGNTDGYSHRLTVDVDTDVDDISANSGQTPDNKVDPQDPACAGDEHDSSDPEVREIALDPSLPTDTTWKIVNDFMSRKGYKEKAPLNTRSDGDRDTRTYENTSRDGGPMLGLLVVLTLINVGILAVHITFGCGAFERRSGRDRLGRRTGTSVSRADQAEQQTPIANDIRAGRSPYYPQQIPPYGGRNNHQLNNLATGLQEEFGRGESGGPRS